MAEQGDDLVDGGFELVFEDGGAEVGLMGRFVEGGAAMKEGYARILLCFEALEANFLGDIDVDAQKAVGTDDLACIIAGRAGVAIARVDAKESGVVELSAKHGGFFGRMEQAFLCHADDVAGIAEVEQPAFESVSKRGAACSRESRKPDRDGMLAESFGAFALGHFGSRADQAGVGALLFEVGGDLLGRKRE